MEKWQPIPEHGLKAWLPALSLSFAAFIFVTSEFVPVGILPDLAENFGRTESETGLLVTVYAWVVALVSLPLTVLSARWERRRLMLTLLGIFIVGNVCSGLSNNFWLLMASRLCVALAHAVFWSITTPLAARMAPEGKRGRALGMVVAGSSLAVILGVPLGTMLGHVVGWRMTFIAIAAVAALVFVAIRKMLPVLPSSNSGSLGSLPSLLKRRALLVVYALTVLTVTGHFAAFTYITPLLRQVGGMTPELAVAALFCLGGAGIPGSWIGGRYADKSPNAVLVAALGAMCVCLALLAFAAPVWPLLFLLAVVWGMSMTVAGLVLQTRVLNIASDAADVAVSMYSGIFNIGIGGGAFLGGRVIALMGMGYVGYSGALFMALSLVILLASLGAVSK